MRNTTTGRGFTLIELLIVVAIIAILALIAVPNFLEAQTRAKVSRVSADMRSLATALESYRTDWNEVPPWDSWEPLSATGIERYTLQTGYFWIALTTPIAYMNQAFRDAFTVIGVRSDPAHTNEGRVLDPFIQVGTGYIGVASGGQESNSHWCAASYGPDNADDTNALGVYPYTRIAIPYDPTNGTVSWGDVYRHSDAPPSNFLAAEALSNVNNTQGVGNPWSRR